MTSPSFAVAQNHKCKEGGILNLIQPSLKSHSLWVTLYLCIIQIKIKKFIIDYWNVNDLPIICDRKLLSKRINEMNLSNVVVKRRNLDLNENMSIYKVVISFSLFVSLYQGIGIKEWESQSHCFADKFGIITRTLFWYRHTIYYSQGNFFRVLISK